MRTRQSDAVRRPRKTREASALETHAQPSWAAQEDCPDGSLRSRATGSRFDGLARAAGFSGVAEAPGEAGEELNRSSFAVMRFPKEVAQAVACRRVLPDADGNGNAPLRHTDVY